MQEIIYINMFVDVISALSSQSLQGNLIMADDSIAMSSGQGTASLVTKCRPGQVIRWLLYQVDVQTPASIRSICFLPPSPADQPLPGSYPIPGEEQAPGAKGMLSFRTAGEERVVGAKGILSLKTPEQERVMGAKGILSLKTPEQERVMGAKGILSFKTSEEERVMGAKGMLSLKTPDGKISRPPLESQVWEGYVPYGLEPGWIYPYRLEIQMGTGDQSRLFTGGGLALAE